MINRNCLCCNKQFKTYSCEIKKGGGKFCSKKCSVIDKTGKPRKPHSEETKKKIRIARAKQITTPETREKMRQSHIGIHKGSKNPYWKGGQFKDKKGYVYILKHEHPRVNKYGYILRSHLVMEKILGRYLTFKEIVHHINEIRDDDRPENLKLFANSSEHQKFHHPKGKNFKQQKFLRFTNRSQSYRP